MIDRPAPARLVLDAAAGTRLIAAGLDLARDDPSLWVVDHPDAVAGLHRADVAAGADAVLTCTFGANRDWLNRWGRGGEAAAINVNAVALARDAAGPGRLVLGSIGPTAQGSSLRDQADALAAAGADGLVLETWPEPAAIDAVTMLMAHVRVPVVVSTFPILKPDVALRLEDAGAAAVGSNCLAGHPGLERWARRLRHAVAVPIWFKPSAGLPDAIESPPAFADRLADLWDFAPIALGGCCGSTAAHVAALAATRPPGPDGNPHRTPRDAWLTGRGGV